MSFIQILAVGFSTFLLVTQGSCTKDTCNDLDTFTAMDASVNSIVEESEVLNVSWTSGKVLPKNYFENIFIYEAFQDKFGVEIKNDFDMIDTIVINSPNDLSIKLKPSALTQNQTNLDFHFFLPDRGDFIDCVHPGSDDEYQLDLSFSIARSIDTLTIDDFTWEETFFAGPF